MYGNRYGEYAYWSSGVLLRKKMTETKKPIKFDAIYFYLQIFTLLPLVPWSFEHQSLCREWTIVQTKFNCVNPHTRHTQDQYEWQGIYIEYISQLLSTDWSVFCKWSLPTVIAL